MRALRDSYRKLADALCRSALREKDFGFVDTPLGQAALAIFDGGSDIMAAFRRAEDEWEDEKARRRSTRNPWPLHRGRIYDGRKS